MTRVPYLNRLGDEFERALGESSPRRPRGVTVLAIAFVMVLLAVGSLWLIRDGRDPDSAEPSATTTTVADEAEAIDAPITPETWARTPYGEPLGAGPRTTLSGIVTTASGFAAVATATADDSDNTPTGTIVVSSDGITWYTLTEVAGVFLSDITFGTDGGLVAVGTRDLRPVLVHEDTFITDLPVRDGSGERAIMARAIAARDTGYVVVGDEGVFDDEQRQRESIWLSDDGVTWTAVEPPSLDWHHEAYLNDVIVTAEGIMAVGLAGDDPGVTVPIVWTSPDDGASWERIELPADTAGGFTGASGVAYGHGRYVVVGDRPSSSGTAGTAWVSEDGHSWVQVDHPALAGAEGAATRIASVAAVADGFVAVGHSLERPASRHVIWTADPSGTVWSRLDLADPGGDVSTSAFSVATDSNRVVVAGATFDITYSEASGAIWVGPAPPSLEVSAPIPTAPPDESEPAEGEGSLEIDPNQAVGATSLRIVGRLPDGHGLDEVLVQLDAGETAIDLCRAVTQGRTFMCRATIAELVPQPEPGTYTVVADGIASSTEPVTVEILPEGSRIIRLSGIYTPTYGPLVQSAIVQNKGGEDLDISYWAIVNEGRDEPRFDFPAGTTVPAGSSVGLDFGGPMGARCPEDTDQYFHWCRVVSDSGRVDYGEEEMLWRGGTLQLVDDNGAVVAEWRPG